MRISIKPDWIFLNISFLWPLPKIFFQISKNPGQSLAATAALALGKEARVAAVIAQAPVSDLEAFVRALARGGDLRAERHERHRPRRARRAHPRRLLVAPDAALLLATCVAVDHLERREVMGIAITAPSW